MNEKEKTALVPKLRFPDCITGEWKICTLCELASRITTRNHDNLVKRVLTNSAINGVVDQSDYFDREVANHLENYFVIDKGDYVYNPRMSATAPVGPISKNKVGKGVMSPLYTVFRFENHNNDFYEQYFKTNLWHSYMKNVSNTGARHDRMSISNDSFMKMPLPYHSEKVQQKIADCLSSLDDLIDAEDKKLEVLKTHKKGLMQKLFPAEGKTVPEWRFSEFRGYGEWEKERLDKFFSIGSSKRVLQEQWTNKGVPFYRTRELVSLSKGEPFGSEIFISEELYNVLSETYGVPSEGDFLVSGVGTLGVSYQVKSEDKFYFKDGNVLWFKLDEGLYSTYFKYSFQSDYIQKQIYGQTSKSTVGTYTIQNAKKTKLLCPPTISEQKKIADCLSSIDNLINEQAKKIEALKLHKKGLMQGLFPSIEEVGE